jgi:carbamoyl-phosphate synthase small subunit
MQTMEAQPMSKAYLVLENGKVYEGKRFGAAGDVTAEAVFTTGMTGYIETLTDPSYYGQMVVQTFPLMGNYGIIKADFESKRPWLSAYIVRSFCESPSNFRLDETLDAFLKAQGIVGLYDVDTRAITRQIRRQGVMNAIIMSDLPTGQAFDALLKKLQTANTENAVQAVTAKTPSGEASERPVVLWDFGHKAGIARALTERGCAVRVMPGNSTAEAILALNPQGVVLSNGPGDPMDNQGIIAQVRLLMQSGLPIMGICLGHQLMALASGAKTEKLKYGHRGANQPVLNPQDLSMYITSQNHGYTVTEDTLPEGAKPLFINANDLTIEGIVYEGTKMFSVQFHPEACGGPHDTMHLFDQFIASLSKEEEHAAQ